MSCTVEVPVTSTAVFEKVGDGSPAAVAVTTATPAVAGSVCVADAIPDALLTDVAGATDPPPLVTAQLTVTPDTGFPN